MKTVACYIIHYGREWLGWSLRSIRDSVDEVYVFYTATPSHGRGTGMKNPETRDELYEIAHLFGAHWVDCSRFVWEGQHREYAVDYCIDKGADIILVVDIDEIWLPSVLKQTLDIVKMSKLRIHRICMRHFWRSLKYVCDDSAAPTRLINVNNPDSESCGYIDAGKVLHMGYAQSPEIIKYKWSIHGHYHELRDGWYKDIFMSWTPGIGDVHPTSKDFWTPIRYKDQYWQGDVTLEHLVGDHPYWDVDVIE